LINNETLTDRQREEAQYHDQMIINERQCQRRTSQSSYYKYFDDLVGEAKGHNVLDLGCGNGWFSTNLVKKGKRVYGVDISHELLKIANEQAKLQGLKEHLHFAKMAAENLAFSNDYFDIIVGSAILHHTFIELTIQCIYDVLKIGGIGIFIEPMNENFLLKIWRRLTPWRRSPLERALENKDIIAIKKLFPSMRTRYFGLTSIISEGLMILIPQSRFLIFLDSQLSRVDAFILKRFPSLGRFCAVVVIELRK